MAYTGIDDSSAFFQTTLYTGNGSNRSITNTGNSDLQPDLIWLKARSESEYNFLYDAVRGATKGVSSDLTAVQATYSDGLTAFGSDGFSLGTSNGINRNGTTYVAWNWKAETTSGIATNASTTITPGGYSFNQTSGMSIINYDGNNTAGAKVPHGLGATPDVMIVKAMNGNIHWAVYHKDIGNTHYLQFDTNAKLDDAGVWNDTSPDSVNFTIGNSDKSNTVTYIAYCFTEKQGYSKFGNYVGNGNADGTYVYLGFKPAFIIIKATSGTENWRMYDNKRNGFNVDNEQLFPNLNNAEASDADLDILSNGFKCRRNSGGFNNSGTTYIYMAFAEQPFVTSTGIPATAR